MLKVQTLSQQLKTRQEKNDHLQKQLTFAKQEFSEVLTKISGNQRLADERHEAPLDRRLKIRERTAQDGEAAVNADQEAFETQTILQHFHAGFKPADLHNLDVTRLCLCRGKICEATHSAFPLEQTLCPKSDSHCKRTSLGGIS